MSDETKLNTEDKRELKSKVRVCPTCGYAQVETTGYCNICKSNKLYPISTTPPEQERGEVCEYCGGKGARTALDAQAMVYHDLLIKYNEKDAQLAAKDKDIAEFASLLRIGNNAIAAQRKEIERLKSNLSYIGKMLCGVDEPFELDDVSAFVEGEMDRIEAVKDATIKSQAERIASLENDLQVLCIKVLAVKFYPDDNPDSELAQLAAKHL